MSTYTKYELTCKPLDTYSEILTFLQRPPAWRTLCKELKPHSTSKIRNKESNAISTTNAIDDLESFCHISPEADEDKRVDEKCLPKTLVCHDMANGYHDDSIIDGTGKHDAYTFYNWAGIDIFCYFSHHLITIPPLGWINVGHDHGVKVIGTVITEWAEGVKFWDRVLSSEEEYKSFASALVAIAKTLKFDGWLLNVENKISKPATLLSFVRHLHGLLHQELDGAVLIWYDSVTVDGNLSWQNGLNDHNRAFFDACDGLFTNYSWGEAQVAASARAAGDRLADLYVGVDVWGRNFYGGGQFNVREAIEIAHKHGCSLAIFAPAWTHEALTTDRKDSNAVALSDHLDSYEHFLLRDRALWDSIWRYLTTKLPSQLPFKTSFCRGQGKTRRLYGEVIGPVPWYNLRHMQYQPNASHGPHGYLLSKLEYIVQAWQTGVLRDTRGVVKYRKQMENNPQTHDEDSIGQDDKTEMETSIPGVNESGETNAIKHAESRPKKSLKRKIKNTFKQILRRRRKGDDNNELEAVEIADDIVDNEDEIRDGDVEREANEEQVIELDNARNKDGAARPNLDLEAVNKDTIGSDEADKRESQGERSDSVAPAVVLPQKNKPKYGLAVVPDEQQCLEVFYEDSFIGGSCLRINPSDSPEHQHRLIRLFQCDFLCENSLIFCVVTKTVDGRQDQFINLELHVQDSHGRSKKVVLIGREGLSERIGDVLSVNVVSDDRFRDIQKYILLNEPGFYVPTENSYDWNVRYYEVQIPGSRVSSINVDTGRPHGPILLGHFGICGRNYTG